MTTPLYWTNPHWNGRDPGAYAVVIGVSQYDHLPGGRGLVADRTYGLSQLKVSALSAYQFFAWLRDEYVCDGVRLVKCWLLVSPTDEELGLQTDLRDLPDATFANARTAVKQWHAEMNGLDEHTAQESKALFFFSGHGLELYQDEHLLLPADVLAPPGSNFLDSLRVQNLRRGMTGLKVRSQQFFVDACRNDHSRLRARRVALRGTDVLEEEGSAWTNPDVVAPVVYATAAGAQAYQETSVAAGSSLFGKALHEGVTKPPDGIRTTEQGICQVDLFRLVGFMSAHITDQLARHDRTATQRVNLGGSGMRPPMVTNDVGDDVDTVGAPPSVEVTRERQQVRSTPLPDTPWRELRGRTDGTNPFASQATFDIWESHTLRTDEGKPVTHALVSVVEYQDGTSRLSVRLPDVRVTAALAIGGFFCRVPPLGPDALLRIDLAGDRCIAVDVDDKSPDVVGQAAATWHQYVDGDLLGAADDTDSLLRQVVDGESPTPYPALVAALIQLRTGDGAQADLSMLKVLYPRWPDFRILGTEHELRTAAGNEIRRRAAASFSDRLVMPYSQEAFGYLVTHARAAAEPGTSTYEVEAALASLSPGGFFCLSATAFLNQ